MKKNILTPFLTTLFCYNVLYVSAKSDNNKGRKTNLLFILTDQQRYDALHLVGHFPFLKTPNLDKLAAEGVYFSKAYSACAVSGPARSTILTGLLVEHTGVLTNELTHHDPVLNHFTTEKTFDQILVQNGYYSEYVGKWHAPIGWADCYEKFTYHQRDKDNPFSYQIDQFFVSYRDYLKTRYGSVQPKKGELRLGLTNYRPDPIDRRLVIGHDKSGNLLVTKYNKRTKPRQPDSHGQLMIEPSESLTAFQAKETIKALKRAKKSGKPFSITCSFNAPHPPMLVTAPYYGMYLVDDMPIPTSIADSMIDSPYKEQNGRLYLREYANPDLLKYMISNYFGMVTEVDYWVGEILKTLGEIGEKDNTLVVFVADHGEHLGAHGMREKNTFYEESARVPFILCLPSKIKPQVIDRNVSTISIFSTVLDYMGIKYNVRDGESLVPLINGECPKENLIVTEWLYHENRSPSHMILKDNWKLFVSYDPHSKVQPVLFDLNTDPDEMHNLIGKHNAQRARFLNKVVELQKDLVCWLRNHNSKYADDIALIDFKEILTK